MSTDTPLKLALIGAGNRASTIYAPIPPHLKQWAEVVAVCDPVAEHADAMSARLGAARVSCPPAPVRFRLDRCDFCRGW